MNKIQKLVYDQTYIYSLIFFNPFTCGLKNKIIADKFHILNFDGYITHFSVHI